MELLTRERKAQIRKEALDETVKEFIMNTVIVSYQPCRMHVLVWMSMK